MTTIAIVEEQILVRAALKSLLSSRRTFRIVGEAGDGLAALELVEKYAPNILLVELALQRITGIELIRRIHMETKTQVVVVTSHRDLPHIVGALQAGAAGYVLKNDTPQGLYDAISRVVSGDLFISPLIKQTALTAFLNKAPSDPYRDLTERERVVLQWSAEGFSNGEIAAKIFISGRTVETHRANLMKKLSLSSQTDLVRFAVRRNIISA